MITEEPPTMSKDSKELSKVVSIDEGRIRDHLGELVRGTVEETLNAMLDAEAYISVRGRTLRAEPRSRSIPGPAPTIGSCTPSAGEVSLKMPKLRRQTFETAIIERYRRREASIEESLIEMYLAGVSVRRVEDITQALCGHPGELWERFRS